MRSAFGVDHAISKSLKPRHLDALKRVAGGKAETKMYDWPKQHYAQARLASHGLKDAGSPEVVQRMTISRGMYKDNAKRAVDSSKATSELKRKGKTGTRVMEGPKVTYGRRKGHLRLVKNGA